MDWLSSLPIIHSNKLVYIKIIAESRLSLRIDFKMVSFLLKFGNRRFPPFKIACYQVIMHVYGGIWIRKKYWHMTISQLVML